MITVYGIPNCDTVKKARDWLTDQGVSHAFHDFKKGGVPPDRLLAWEAAVGWQKLLNRQGTTWRRLEPAIQQTISDATSAARLMQSQPSAIKRPVVDWGSTTTVGFDPAVWARLLPRKPPSAS